MLLSVNQSRKTRTTYHLTLMVLPYAYVHLRLCYTPTLMYIIFTDQFLYFLRETTNERMKVRIKQCMESYPEVKTTYNNPHSKMEFSPKEISGQQYRLLSPDCKRWNVSSQAELLSAQYEIEQRNLCVSIQHNIYGAIVECLERKQDHTKELLKENFIMQLFIRPAYFYEQVGSFIKGMLNGMSYIDLLIHLSQTDGLNKLTLHMMAAYLHVGITVVHSSKLPWSFGTNTYPNRSIFLLMTDMGSFHALCKYNAYVYLFTFITLMLMLILDKYERLCIPTTQYYSLITVGKQPMRCVLSTFILPDKVLKKFINLTPTERQKCQVPYVEPKKVLRSNKKVTDEKEVTDETSTDARVTRQKGRTPIAKHNSD